MRHTGSVRSACTLAALLFLSAPASSAVAVADAGAERDRFARAWRAASSGDRATFEQLEPGLRDYVLHPYLEYTDLLARRATVAAPEMAAFLAAHRDWAFTNGLRRSWLRTLGQQRRWPELLQHAPGEADTEVRCHLAQARIRSGQQAEALRDAEALWSVGASQPDACDPVFTWLQKDGRMTPQLAWARVRLAMEARNPRLTIYLARFVPARKRVWVERWQRHDQQGYTRLDLAREWPDVAAARDITDFGLRQLARKDADRAARLFGQLDGHFDWGTQRRGGILRDIALRSAVGRSTMTKVRMRAVPEASRDDELLEWWARSGLSSGDWAEVILAVAAMQAETRDSDRWRYWDARARLQMGDPGYANELLDALSREASFHGFLAADHLDRAYAICPGETAVEEEALQQFVRGARMSRVFELQHVGLANWAWSEWDLAVGQFSPEELRLAAAVATRENWHYQAIVALAKSGDTDWYDWRFPLAHLELVAKEAERRRLDTAWVMGLMRAESAMATGAVSAADARGLMQVMPATARDLARRHAYPYDGSEQLLRPEVNVLFGTTLLRDLMDRFDDNAVLASGAYNAGPGAVNRWLDDLPVDDMPAWIESLPYRETREYIPRVLAYATIYDWRMQRPLRRISARMAPQPSGNMARGTLASVTAATACPGGNAAGNSGS